MFENICKIEDWTKSFDNEVDQKERKQNHEIMRIKNMNKEYPQNCMNKCSDSLVDRKCN